MSKKIEPDFSQKPGPALHSARWRFGPFELDETRRELRRDGELLAIEPKPLNMLMLLLRHPGELVTKSELLDALWTGRMVNEAVVGNCISSVRDVLGELGGAWLKTVHGFGYRLDAPIQLIEDDNRAPAVADAKLGFQIGDQPPMRPNWRLLRRLGQTGDTWLAEHPKLRERRVFKFTTEPGGLSALKREVTIHRLLRQSLGDKDHYVDVLDWNFDEPPYFIETEYCHGGSLLEWFESQGGAAKVPLDTRIELVARIADALADVHLVGVLHKDLKPANVFVVPGDGDIPGIRLADFGASRILDPGVLARLEITRHGFTQVIDPNADLNAGTLLYLAPEVASGHPATAKADIYALGVMLYQFVVGSLRRQLGAGWEVGIDDEMLRADIAVAAENDPERRLANAAELARRLRTLAARRRAHADAIEAARQADAAARALERIKARRVGVMLAFAALAAGLVVSTFLYIEARAAKAVAERAAAKATAIYQFLGSDLLAGVSEDTPQVQKITVREVLDSAAAKVDQRFAGDALTAAEVHLSLSDSFWAIDRVEEACREAELAIIKAEPLTRESSSVAARAAATLVIRAYVRGTLPTAFVRVLNTSDAIAAFLDADDPARIELRIERVRGQFMLGHWALAAREAEALIAELSGLPRPDADDITQLRSILGSSELALGQFASSSDQLQHVLDARLNAANAQPQRIAQARIAWAQALIKLGRFDDAERELAEALKTLREWNAAANGPELFAKRTLLRLRMAQGKTLEARDMAITLVAEEERFFAGNADRSQRIDGLQLLAELHRDAGHLPLAKTAITEALQIRAGSSNPEHPDARESRLILAETLLVEQDLMQVARELSRDPPLQFADLPPGHDLNRRIQRLRTVTASPKLQRDESRQAVRQILDVAGRQTMNDASITPVKSNTK
ncbi:MAG: hypothetical protein C0434_02970 [Xanthomonadaceae bacterium]|nr:hypothetical protein [Xanthomonadaceae bacterium]